MDVVTLSVPESQVVEWVQQLSPKGKRAVLQSLIPAVDELEVLVEYGNERIRALCAQRGLNWDGLREDEREQLIDELLHQK